MRRTIILAIATIGILATQAQTPVVNYKFEETLSHSRYEQSLTQSSNNPNEGNITKSRNVGYVLPLNSSELQSANFLTPSNSTGNTINYWVIVKINPNCNVGVCRLKYTQTTGLPNKHASSFIPATNPSSFIASKEKRAIGSLLHNMNGIDNFQSSFDGWVEEVHIF